MKCPNRETEVSELAHFCPQCGHEIGGDFCAVCGQRHNAGGGSKIDRYIWLAIFLGTAGWLGQAYYQTHSAEIKTRLHLQAENLQARGAAAALHGLEVVAGVAPAAQKPTPKAPAPQPQPEKIVVKPATETRKYDLVTDKKILAGENTTHDLKAIVGPKLTHEELSTIAHAILDDLVARSPEDLFILTIFDGEPSGDELISERDPHFVAKFLYLNRLHEPGAAVPADYTEIATNFFVKWDE